MQKLIATLCLTFAVLIGTAGCETPGRQVTFTNDTGNKYVNAESINYIKIKNPSNSKIVIFLYKDAGEHHRSPVVGEIFDMSVVI